MASIRKRGKSYQITVSNGRDIHDKQILETTTWTPDPEKTEKQNQKALERFMMEFEERVKNGKYLSGEKITFKAFTEKWMEEYAKLQLEATTVENYTFLLNTHILPAIGHLKLSRVQPAHLNKLYSTMLEERKDGKEGGYSPTTIKRCHATISSIMSTAVQWNIITENPCQRVKPPKQTRNSSDIKFFTPEQAERFLAELNVETADGRIQLQHNIFFQLALFCGMRRSELVALHWSDIDYSQRTICINKCTTIVKNQPYQKNTKNRTSERTIAIPDSVLVMLKSYRLEYNKYRLSIGSQWVGDDYIFIQWNGSQMYPSTPDGVIRKVIDRYNANHEDKLPPVTPHGLRHTSATLLISENVDVRTVSGRLGHAQTSTTLNIYSHSLQKKDAQAAQTLETLLSKRA